MLFPHAAKMKELIDEQEDAINEHTKQKIHEQIQEFVEIGEFTADLYKRAYNGVE